MLYQWYEMGLFTYLVAAMCGIGVLSKLVLGHCMNGWLRSTERMGTPGKKWLQNMKQEYAECCLNYGKVNNVDIFVDKHLGNCRYFGVRLSTWKKISGQVILMSVGLIVFTIAVGFLYKQDAMRIMFEFFVGSWLILINLVVDNLTNMEEKEAQIRVNLMEFFENHPLVETLQEAPVEKEEMPEKEMMASGENTEEALKMEESSEKAPEENAVKAESRSEKEEDAQTEEKQEEKGRKRAERGGRTKAVSHRREQLKAQLIEERKQKRAELLKQAKEEKMADSLTELQAELAAAAEELPEEVKCAEEIREEAGKVPDTKAAEKAKENSDLIAEVLKEFLV